MTWKTGDGGLSDLATETATLKLSAGQTTWLNRAHWFVHDVAASSDHVENGNGFAMSLHVYKSCTDEFTFVTRQNEAQKGNPKNDLIWNIDLEATDPRLNEGVQDFETAIGLHEMRQLPAQNGEFGTDYIDLTPRCGPQIPVRDVEGGLDFQSFESSEAYSTADDETLDIADGRQSAASRNASGTEPAAKPAKGAWRMALQPIPGAWIPAAKVPTLLATTVVGSLFVSGIAQNKNLWMKAIAREIDMSREEGLAWVALAAVECFLLAAGFRALRSLFLEGWPPKMQVLTWSSLQPGLCWHTCLWAQLLAMIVWAEALPASFLWWWFFQFGGLSLLWTLLACWSMLCGAFDSRTPKHRSFLALLWHLIFTFLALRALCMELGPKWIRRKLQSVERLQVLEVLGAPHWLCEKVGHLDLGDVMGLAFLCVLTSSLYVVVAWLVRAFRGCSVNWQMLVRFLGCEGSERSHR